MTRRTSRAAATLTAQNTFTPWVEIRGHADVSISGVTDSTVTVQRTFDDAATVKDIESFTGPVEKQLDGSIQGAKYRIGIKTGNYGSDTVLCEISQ